MHPSTLLTLTLASLTPLAISATAVANPNPNPIDPRATQLRWDALRDGKICTIRWSGVCYEHCVTEGTKPAKKCQRDTITSAIDGSGCGWFKSRCKCTCVVP